jgi:hypothetical protein
MRTLTFRGPLVRDLLHAIALSCVAALPLLAPAGTSAAPAHSAARGTWMAGPGCGRLEWLQHPSAFPYFCDGAAFVEKVRWRSWGSSTAKASATMNEADLRHGKSVATAPRIRSAVTIIASHIELCGHRRVYSSVAIHFNRPNKGPSTLHLASYLPRGCSPVP